MWMGFYKEINADNNHTMTDVDVKEGITTQLNAYL